MENFIIVKKVVPPVEGEDQPKVENKIVREGLNKLLEELRDNGFLTIDKEPIDGYTVVTIKVAIPDKETDH